MDVGGYVAVEGSWLAGGDREGEVCRDIHDLSSPFGPVHISELLQEDLDLLPIGSALGDQMDALQDTSKLSAFSSSSIILHRQLTDSRTVMYLRIPNLLRRPVTEQMLRHLLKSSSGNFSRIGSRSIAHSTTVRKM